MDLFYCMGCGAVFLFNTHSTNVHTLTCRACGKLEAFLEVQIEQKIAMIARSMINSRFKEKTVEIKVLEMS